MKEASPYLTSEEAAAHLRFPSVHAFYCWRWRRKKAGFPIKEYRRGGVLLFRLVDLDAAMSVTEAPTVRPLRVVGRS